jgi:putative endopeptidase
MSVKTKKNKIKNKKTRKIKNVTRYDKKDDFYFSVNNPWISNNTNKKSLHTNMFIKLQNKVDKQLLNVIKNHLIKENSSNGKRCKSLYISLTEWNDNLVNSQIYQQIGLLDDFRKNSDNLYDYLCHSLKHGLIVPIDFGIINDIKNANHYIASISESGLVFLNKETYFSNSREYVKIRDSYKEFISGLFELFFGKQHIYSATDAYNIEIELAKKMYTLKDLQSPIKTYNKFTNYKTKMECNFELDIFLDKLGLNNIKYVNIINPDYLKHAMILMKNEWTSVKWYSYWIYKLLFSFSKFHSKLYYYIVEQLSLNIQHNEEPKNLEMIAVNTISSVMNTSVSKKYIELYKNDPEIKYTSKLTNYIKNTFETRLHNNAWLLKNTKEKALEKLNKMKFAIGYRKKFSSDPDCEFDDYDDFSNNTKYLNWLLKKFKREINKKIPDNSYWLVNEEMNVFNVNAFYNNVENQLILPNALLQKPIVDLSKDLTYNLANIGFAIAHEMVHAFDIEGSKFDEKGELNYWWTDGDIEKYISLQKKVIEQYEDIAKKDRINIDGKLTLSENIADISALHLIEDTLEDYLTSNNISVYNQKKYFKKLYHYFAKQWRTTMTPKKEKSMVMIDEHSLAKYRVNCVLMRSRRFQSIFNISPNDGMYYPLDMNEIW